MRKHPKAGCPVKIANGPLKGQYFMVGDFLESQFQGKSIAGIIADHEHLVQAARQRGFPLDSDLVIGKLYPAMNVIVVHDKELQVEMTVHEGGGETVELPPNVEPMSKKRKPKTVKSEKEKRDAEPKDTTES
jgi:hypothetical protein